MTLLLTEATLRKRDPLDFYPTPQELADRAVLELVPDYRLSPTTLDPGAGSGPWGMAVRKRWADAYIVGYELRQDAPKHPAYDAFFNSDFLAVDDPAYFNLVVGNPPYSLAERFIRHSFKLLDHGHMLLLLRLGFLASVGRGRGLWQEYPPSAVHICTHRPSFTGDGKTDATEYALYHWNLATMGSVDTVLKWWDWKEEPMSASPQERMAL